MTHSNRSFSHDVIPFPVGHIGRLYCIKEVMSGCPNKDLKYGDWSASMLAGKLDYKTAIGSRSFSVRTSTWRGCYRTFCHCCHSFSWYVGNEGSLLNSQPNLLQLHRQRLSTCTGSEILCRGILERDSVFVQGTKILFVIFYRAF